LVRYYRKFTANVASDPTGYKTLEALLKDELAVDNMTKFQQRWQRYVMSLHFP
jgi:hypothetical protein